MSDDAEPVGAKRSFDGRVPVIVVLAVALVLAVWTRPDRVRSDGTVTIVPSAATVGVWKAETITTSAADRAQPPHTMRFVDGAFRVSSTAANTDRNRREVWTYDRVYDDVDVTVRIDAPSSLGGEFNPQTGIALRVDTDTDGSGRAIIVDTNVWKQGFKRMIVGVWRWPDGSESAVKIDTLASPLVLHERSARIIGTIRNAGSPPTDVFMIDPSFDLAGPYGFGVGDVVDIESSLDESYSRSGAAITAVDVDRGWITVEHAGTADATPLAPGLGTIGFAADGKVLSPRALYPRYVRASVVGSTLRVKSWLVDEPEPGWQITTHIPADLAAPARGKVGLVTNHLSGAGQYMAFGDVTITPLTGP